MLGDWRISAAAKLHHGDYGRFAVQLCVLPVMAKLNMSEVP